jgi:hypothetical protein
VEEKKSFVPRAIEEVFPAMDQVPWNQDGFSRDRVGSARKIRLAGWAGRVKGV